MPYLFGGYSGCLFRVANENVFALATWRYLEKLVEFKHASRTTAVALAACFLFESFAFKWSWLCGYLRGR